MRFLQFSNFYSFEKTLASCQQQQQATKAFLYKEKGLSYYHVEHTQTYLRLKTSFTVSSGTISSLKV
jgi:hypothetical protein